MARPVWTGSISFGLVNIPIKLFGAIESHRVSFREFERGTGKRIRHKRVAEGSGREVSWDQIQKGFAVGKDRFVVLTDDELEAAEPRRSHTLDIRQFVPLQDIDPVSWDQCYYVAPDGPAAARAYVLLRDAMKKEGRVAVGQFVMRTKEFVACLRPYEHALALNTMYFADEVRDVKDVVELPAGVAAGAKELEMARRLIDSLASRWDPRAYEDTFKKSVLAVVHKKERGEVIEAKAGAEQPGRVLDLMEALKATLSHGDKAARVPRRRAARKPRARAAASSGRH
jgi:DNA end-binding protein Ku